jgi:hypothetical protein
MAGDRAVSAGHVREVILPDLDSQSGQAGLAPGESMTGSSRAATAGSSGPRARMPLFRWPSRSIAPRLSPTCPSGKTRFCASSTMPWRTGPNSRFPRPGPCCRTIAPWSWSGSRRRGWTSCCRAPGAGPRSAGGCSPAPATGCGISMSAPEWTCSRSSPNGCSSASTCSSAASRAPASRSATTFRKAYAVLLEGIAEFAGAPLPHATAHGDFQAKNLLHGRRGTVGIDMTGLPTRPSPTTCSSSWSTPRWKSRS